MLLQTHIHTHTCMHIHIPLHLPPLRSPSPCLLLLCKLHKFCGQIEKFLRIFRFIWLYFILFSTFQFGLEYFLLFLFARFFAGCPLYRCLAEKYESLLEFTLQILWLLKRFPCKTANFINYFDLVCISPTQAKGVELGHKFGHCLPLHSNNWAAEQTKCSLSCSRAVKRGRAGCKLRFHTNKTHFNSDN